MANMLLARGIYGLTTGPTATLMLTDPVVATLLGVVVLGEALAPVAALGVALVFAGLLLQGMVLARDEPAPRKGSHPVAAARGPTVPAPPDRRSVGGRLLQRQAAARRA